MGKRARAAQKEKRLKAKRAKKEAQKALYASWRDAGKNKKSKRFLKKNKGANKTTEARIVMLIPVKIKGEFVLVARKVHGGRDCGNVGCKKCSPVWIGRA